MPSTFPDFWRMLWEFDVPTIVMVTNLTEDDKASFCHTKLCLYVIISFVSFTVFIILLLFVYHVNFVAVTMLVSMLMLTFIRSNYLFIF